MATILIGGGSGLVGMRLSELLVAKGHQVRHLSRKKKNGPYPTFIWNLNKATIEDGAFDGVDYVVNLAGAGIADKRWSAKRKKLIIDSRVGSAALLLKYLKQSSNIKAYLGASATGYYGNRGQELLTEESSAGQGFLTQSCQAWEKGTQSIRETGLRTLTLRIGIVLSTQGGALPKMLLPFKFGMANYMGDGQQIYSWVHIDDLAEIIQHLLFDQQATGIFNAVAPKPVSNYDFTKTIQSVKYPRSVVLPAPAFALKLALGEMSKVVLDGSRVSARKIINQGYIFNYPDLASALKNLFSEQI